MEDHRSLCRSSHGRFSRCQVRTLSHCASNHELKREVGGTVCADAQSGSDTTWQLSAVFAEGKLTLLPEDYVLSVLHDSQHDLTDVLIVKNKVIVQMLR